MVRGTVNELANILNSAGVLANVRPGNSLGLQQKMPLKVHKMPPSS